MEEVNLDFIVYARVVVLGGEETHLQRAVEESRSLTSAITTGKRNVLRLECVDTTTYASNVVNATPTTGYARAYQLTLDPHKSSSGGLREEGLLGRDPKSIWLPSWLLCLHFFWTLTWLFIWGLKRITSI